MSNPVQILTSVPYEVLAAELATQLQPYIEKAVRDYVGDQFVTLKEAAYIIGVTDATISKWLTDGVLTNYSGNSHHRFSRNEVIELRKQVVNGRLKRKYTRP